MATPEIHRDPPTHQEFAKIVGVRPRTLRRWKKKPGFWDAVREEVRRHLQEELPNIYEALLTEAKKGNMTAIRLALESAGELIQLPHQTTINVQPFTIEELAAAQALSQEWLSEQLDEKVIDIEPNPVSDSKD